MRWEVGSSAWKKKLEPYHKELSELCKRLQSSRLGPSHGKEWIRGHKTQDEITEESTTVRTLVDDIGSWDWREVERSELISLMRHARAWH